MWVSWGQGQLQPEVVKSLMSYVSEGDVGRHLKFDNFLFWSAVLAGVESRPHVVGGTLRHSDISSNQLSGGSRPRRTIFFYFLFIFLLQYFEFQEEARFSVKSGNMLVNKRWKTGIFWLMWKINIKFPRTLQKYQRREGEQEDKYYCWWVHLAHSPASLLLFTRKVAKLS